MKKITSVCPYCGAGCKLKLVVDNNKIIRAEAADGVTNQNQLCLKGYYGWDFLNDTQLLTPRLKQPMIRYQKGGAFTPVSWQEAIRYTASKLREIKGKHGPRAIMTTGSSRGTGNETNYVMQKFARAVLNTNNVDCCARVCHGPSVAGLQQALGNGAMSNSISDIENSKCLLVFGYNCADSHPIVARRVIKARDNGAKIIICDPRRIETARIADRHLQLNNGSNMALVNAFGYVLLEEELYNKTYVERYTEGLDAYREAVKDYAPEAVEGIVGVSAREIREAMRMFAAAPSATIMWGMGVHPVWPGGGRGARPGKPGAAHRQPGTAQRRRGAGPRAKQRTGRLRYGRAAEPVPRLSGGHRPRRAGEILRRLGHRPGADGRPGRHPHHRGAA
ncbi:formate dehydrogenase H, selenopolypeptide subunit [Klebsiella pneumoniae subsp. rhinoscleromatis]|nr:formate dehydrogenase H, selenopolypeptide subunit [Klebsiella pneumoniae subsp. rhinoscleromatis]